MPVKKPQAYAIPKPLVSSILNTLRDALELDAGSTKEEMKYVIARAKQYQAELEEIIQEANDKAS